MKNIKNLKELREMIDEKLNDASTPGFVSELDPDEAEELGVFEETALSETDAFESAFDLEI